MDLSRYLFLRVSPPVLPVGMHTVGLECLCTASGWKAGGTGIGSLLVRDVRLAYDGEE